MKLTIHFRNLIHFRSNLLRRSYSDALKSVPEADVEADAVESEIFGGPFESMHHGLTPEFSVGHNRIGAAVVPEALQSGLTRVLKSYPRRQLRQDVAKLAEACSKMTQISAKSLLETNFENSSAWSEADRQAIVEFSAGSVDYGPNEVFAYISSQLPFALAPLQSVFDEILRRIPDFVPRTMLDFGSGPGTAIFAAVEAWNRNHQKDSPLKSVLAVDVSQSMLEISSELMKHYPQLEGRVDRRRYMPMNPNRPKYDLVVAATVLSELPDDHLRLQSIDHLWQQTGDILVLIDRGNAEGFRILRNARDRLINKFKETDPFHIVAPVKQSILLYLLYSLYLFICLLHLLIYYCSAHMN